MCLYDFAVISRSTFVYINCSLRFLGRRLSLASRRGQDRLLFIRVPQVPYMLPGVVKCVHAATNTVYVCHTYHTLVILVPETTYILFAMTIDSEK